MRELLGRTLHDVAQVLESAEGSEKRMLHVLELLRRMVPYEQCALLVARPGRERLLLTMPTPLPEVRAVLSETLAGLHARLVDERTLPQHARRRPWGTHLAVPLVGGDETIGVLFVSGALDDGSPGPYTSQHLRELSIVGALLAGYLGLVDQARTLAAARHKAEAANRTKDEFMALISNELRGPLTSTLLWTRMLRSEVAGPYGRAVAATAIERSVEVQTKLVDEILELACIATAQLRLELKSVEPATLIRAAVVEQRLLADQRSIRIETTIDESIDRLVVDPVRIVQVISSVLAKAIHQTPIGGRVGVCLERASGSARIRVIDHGSGLPPEVPPVFEETADMAAIARLAGISPGVLGQVFEEFRVAHDPVTCAFGELGLGLAVVKALVEAHGGRVYPDCPGDEVGSAFTLELPMPGGEPPDGSRLLAGICVLIVDDDDELRNAAREVLETEGAEVTAVGSAAAALAALERSKPHVLLSDLSSRSGSGHELVHVVLAHGATLPAIAVTTLATEEDRRRALAAGIRVHLAKPLETGSLVTAVAALTGRPLAQGSTGATPPAKA
jgi:signal transduction histidine kinase/CheY-like chemotaxis protein